MNHKGLRWAISIAAVAAAIVHLVRPDLAIDGATITLLLVSLIPWLQPLFKSLELPGGVKVEFQDLENVAARADAAGLLPTTSQTRQATYSFQQIASADPNLALAGLRIELERRLDQLAQSRGHEVRSARGIGSLLRELRQQQLINGAEYSVLTDLAALLNAAVHGAHVDGSASEWAFEIGPRILQALEERTDSKDFRYKGISGEGGVG